jgi:signal transduction histidine kinase
LPEEIAAGKPARELAAAARDGRVEDEGWRVRKDGSRFWADVVITAITDQARVLQGFAKVTRDVSERRRLEEQQGRLGLLAERERIAQGLFDEAAQAVFGVGLGLQAATFADDGALRARVDGAVRDLDEVIVGLRRHVFQLRSD